MLNGPEVTVLGAIDAGDSCLLGLGDGFGEDKGEDSGIDEAC
jgi:hypothetical protein